MKKILFGAIAGFLLGAIVLGIAMFNMMPSMMLVEHE